MNIPDFFLDEETKAINEAALVSKIRLINPQVVIMMICYSQFLDLKALLEHAVTKWLPTKDELNKCRMIYDNYSGLFDSPDIRSETKENFDADELDEDTIQEIQASRMIGGDKKGEKGKIQSKEICFFKDVGHMKYQLSQFPNGIKEDTQLIKSAKLWKLWLNLQ